MNATRVIYIVQGYVQVYMAGSCDPRNARTFADDADGRRDFERYFAAQPSQRSVILVDVIEEMFVPDAVPKLNPRDRGSLLQRRIQRKFPRTQYRLPILQGGRADEPRWLN